MASLRNLIDARHSVGNDLDRVLDERNRVRRRKQDVRTAEEKKHDEQREKELEQREKELVAKERDLTKRINALQKRNETLVEKIKRARREKQERNRIIITGGDPHWGGGADIMQAEVDPVAARFGAPETSHKRAANDPLTISNPSSDHSALALYAYATDYGTFDGAPLAHAIASALGISGYSTGNYNGYYIQRAGHTFRVQILWAVEGHFNHVHVGIRLV